MTIWKLAPEFCGADVRGDAVVFSGFVNLLREVWYYGWSKLWYNHSSRRENIWKLPLIFTGELFLWVSETWQVCACAKFVRIQTHTLSHTHTFSVGAFFPPARFKKLFLKPVGVYPVVRELCSMSILYLEKGKTEILFSNLHVSGRRWLRGGCRCKIPFWYVEKK